MPRGITNARPAPNSQKFLSGLSVSKENLVGLARRSWASWILIERCLSANSCTQFPSWGSDCFPGQSPRVAPFVLPDSQGAQANSISLGASMLSLFIPSLNFNRQSLANYRLDLENTQVHTFAKGDLSQQFSEKCVQSLARAIKAGDRIGFFAIILEAVISEGMTLELNWQSGTAVEARAAQRNQAMQQLGSILSGYSEKLQGSGSGLKVTQDNAKKSVIKTNNPVIIGYRIRPLQPVYKK